MIVSRVKPSADAWPRTISSLGRRTCGASPRSTPSTSPAWRMCSTSMPSSLTRSGRLVCFDESPTQLIGEARQPIPACRTLEHFDYEIAATAPSKSLRLRRCPSRSWRRSRSLIVAPLTTSPFACASSSMSTSQRPSASASSSITSPPTAAALYAAFPPAEARRVLRRLEFPLHANTPAAQHG